MCDDDGGEPVDFQTEYWIKARKHHQCETRDCDINIRPGDRYHRNVVGFEGTVTVEKHCARCWAIVEALWKAGAQCIDMRLDCGEKWEDHWDPGAEPGHLAFMTADEAQAQLAGAKP
jgi:hypothetical protein